MLNRTFPNFSLFTVLIGLCGLMFSLTGCGGGGGSAGSAGPSGGSSFTGATISINPTFQFLAGGGVNYQNVESGSSFPASASVTAGTYVYAPSSDYKTGVLTISLGAPLNTSITLNLSDFGASNGNVTSFKASYNGTTYTGNVASGSVVAYVASSSGGSTGGTTGGTLTNVSVGSSTSFYVATLQAVEVNTSVGGAFTSGQLLTFNVAPNTLTFAGTTLSAPTVETIDLTQKNYIYTDPVTGLKYSVGYQGETFNGVITVLNTGGVFVAAFGL